MLQPYVKRIQCLAVLGICFRRSGNAEKCAKRADLAGFLLQKAFLMVRLTKYKDAICLLLQEVRYRA